MKHFLQYESSRRLGKWLSLVVGGFFLGCSANAAPANSPDENAAPTASTKTRDDISEASQPKQVAPPIHSPPENSSAKNSLPRELPPRENCGNHTCYRFQKSSDVLVPLVLHHRARLLAFGEAHTPATFKARSTVKRFTEDLLPTVAEGSSHLLVELLQPPATGCEQEKKVVKKESDKITKGQAKNNQNEYLALGTAAHTQGIVPDILHATCEDLSLIASKEGGVVAMMKSIARLSSHSLKRQLASTKKGRPLILAYGGALHNDAAPREDRESWSYGPSLVEATQGAYLEIDLIIPELIGDSSSWRSFAWYDAYAELDHQEGVILMQWGERSYSLFFAPGDRESNVALQKAQTE